MVPDPPGPPGTPRLRAARPVRGSGCGRRGGRRGRPGGRERVRQLERHEALAPGPAVRIAAGQTPSLAALDDEEARRRVEAARPGRGCSSIDSFGQRERVVARRLGEPDREVRDDRARARRRGRAAERRLPRTPRRAPRSAPRCSRAARPSDGQDAALNSRQPAIAKAGPEPRDRLRPAAPPPTQPISGRAPAAPRSPAARGSRRRRGGTCPRSSRPGRPARRRGT